eukprot:TRINITY_DN2269_c0_g2_i1.p1 TRINITY_DN2269_c0_g2~~TRINITY_DN2269_c0_g2_i1.p1  ORF type:complete len:1362 (+),score=209.72 TRINITY_DN2269_c0_g2_i1:1089-5174(+)
MAVPFPCQRLDILRHVRLARLLQIQSSKSGINGFAWPSTTSATGALFTDGSIFVWGGNTGGVAYPFPQCISCTANAIGAKFVKFAAGGGTDIYGSQPRVFIIAIEAGGVVYSGGSNAEGELGNGGTTDSASLNAISLTNATHVAAGYRHAAAIVGGTQLYVWGCYNTFVSACTLVSGSTSSTPTLVAAFSTFMSSKPGVSVVDFRAGGESYFLLLSDGSVASFGTSTTTATRLCRSSASGIASINSPAGGMSWVAIDPGFTTLALTASNGSMYTCGGDDSGGYGGNAVLCRYNPSPTTDSCGLSNTCSWPTSSPTPAPIMAVSQSSTHKWNSIYKSMSSGFRAAAMAHDFSIFLANDGGLMACGLNGDDCYVPVASDDGAISPPLGWKFPFLFSSNTGGVLRGKHVRSLSSNAGVTYLVTEIILTPSTDYLIASSPSITLFGVGFGDYSDGEAVRVVFSGVSGVRNCSSSPSASEASILFRNSTMIQCAFGQATSIGALYAQLFIGADRTPQPVQVASIAADPSFNQSQALLSYSSNFLTIYGANFGVDTSALSVSLTPSQTGCIVQLAMDSSIQCRVSNQIVGTLLSAVVYRLGASSNAGIPQVIARVVPTHAIFDTPTLELPTNVESVPISGSNLYGLPEDQVFISVDFGSSSSAIPCSRFTISSISITCWINMNGATGALFANVTVGGYTARAKIASVVPAPAITIPDSNTKLTPESIISIKGQNFGTVSTQDVVSLRLATSTKRSADLNTTCIIDSVQNTEIRCRPATVLSNGLLYATIYRSGAAASPADVLLGTVVSPPAVTQDTSDIADSCDIFYIFGSFPTTNISDVSVSLTSSGRAVPCIPTSVSFSVIQCQPSGVLSLKTLVASINIFGTVISEVVGNVVPGPQIRSNAPTSPPGVSQVTISGSGFDEVNVTTRNQVFLEFQGAAVPCNIDASSNATSILCNIAPISSAGTVTAKVRANNANSSSVAVLILTDSSGVASNAAAIGGGVGGGIAGLLLIVLAIFVILYRRWRKASNKAGIAIDVPAEMAYLFNIQSSDVTLLSKLGEGAFGAVYLGKYKGRHVAVKKLSSAMFASHVADFFREAALMMSVPPHRNVTKLYGLVQEENNFALVMQFMANGSLEDMAKRQKDENNGRYPENLMFKIVLGIARAMEHLAAQRVVHRDLAARNILLTDSFEPKVADFGLSRVVSAEDDKVGQTKSDIGPIRSMAPECIRDRQYSEKSDVWAWGVTIYELFMGDLPYPGMEMLEIALQVRDQGLTPENELVAAGQSGQAFVPDWLMQILPLCWKQTPEERPTFSDLVAMVSQYAPRGYVDEDVGDDALEVKKHKKDKHKEWAYPSYHPAPAQAQSDYI